MWVPNTDVEYSCMFRSLSNDQSLEDACPSLARAAATYREQHQKETTEIALSPVEKLQGALASMSEQLASFIPGSTRSADLVCQLAATRPDIVSAMRDIAAAPETTANEYRLTDAAFDRLWEKSLKVTAALDTLLIQADPNSAATFGELHARVLDATLEINRATARRESAARAEILDETPVSLSEARQAAKELDERQDDTSWTVRGL